jgi:Ca2+:H+ antiporter
VIPAAYHSAKHVISPEDGNLLATIDPFPTDQDQHTQEGLSIISRGTAILLLGVYVAYLVFQLKTHASLFVPKPARRHTDDTFVEDVEDHPCEPQQIVEDPPEMSAVAAGLGYVRVHRSRFSGLKKTFSLLIVTVVTSLIADYCEFQGGEAYFWLNVTFCSVIASIEETAHELDISKSFIGLILLPLVVSTPHVMTYRFI